MRAPLIALRHMSSRIWTAVAVMLLIGGSLIALPQLASAQSGFVTDQFNDASLQSHWTVTDHVGDGTVELTGSHLSLSVPAGVSHDPWNTNRSLRVLQPVDNTDLSVEAKFDSAPNAKFQAQGILVQQDSANWLRFDVYHDGSSLRVFAAATVSGTSSTQLNTRITGSQQIVISVSRSGSTWSMTVAADGNSPRSVGSFSSSLAANAVGPFVSNHGSGSSIPAFTALVDHIVNLDASEPEPEPTPDPEPTQEPTPDPEPTQEPTPDPEPTEEPAPSSGIVADEFEGSSLNTDLWTFVDPLNDGTVSVTNGELHIGVPAGKSHDPWKKADAPRVVQQVGNEDIAVEAKFNSVPSAKTQMQGLLFEQDSTNFTRFGTYHDGTRLRIFASSTVNGAPTSRFNQPLPAVSNVYLQVSRTGDGWTYRWSSDGEAWQTAITFTHAVNVARVGPYAGNASGSSSPAYTARVDYVAPPGDVTDPPDPDPTDPPDPDPTDPPDPDPTDPPEEPEPPAGAEVQVWYGPQQSFGTPALAQKWVNIVGTVGDPDNVSSLTYKVNGGQARPLSIGPDKRRLERAGDFNADIPRADLNNGANTVTVTAVYGNGSSVTESVTVNVSNGSLSLPYTANWTADTSVHAQAQPVDGLWKTSNGSVRTVMTGYDRVLAVGHMSWKDYEVTVPMTLHGIGEGAYTPLSGAPLIGLGMRWQGHGHFNDEQPGAAWYPVGAYSWYRFHETGARWELTGNAGTPRRQGPRDAISFDVGDTYLMKVKVQSLAIGARYSMKMWKQGTSEPTSWMLTLDDDDTQANGAVALIAHHADATFGPVQITPLTP